MKCVIVAIICYSYLLCYYPSLLYLYYSFYISFFFLFLLILILFIVIFLSFFFFCVDLFLFSKTFFCDHVQTSFSDQSYRYQAREQQQQVHKKTKKKKKKIRCCEQDSLINTKTAQTSKMKTMKHTHPKKTDTGSKAICGEVNREWQEQT